MIRRPLACPRCPCLHPHRPCRQTPLRHSSRCPFSVALRSSCSFSRCGTCTTTPLLPQTLSPYRGLICLNECFHLKVQEVCSARFTLTSSTQHHSKTQTLPSMHRFSPGLTVVGTLHRLVRDGEPDVCGILRCVTTRVTLSRAAPVPRCLRARAGRPSPSPTSSPRVCASSSSASHHVSPSPTVP